MATYSDNFNRADSGSNAGWGANWQHYTSGSLSNTGWEILSNQGRVSASFTARAALWNGGSVTADQSSRVAIAALSVDGHAYAVVRGTDDQNLYRGGFLNSSTVRISKLVAGASTTIGTQSVTFSAGDVVELRVVGSSLSLYVNDVLQIGPTTDTEYSSGRPGMAVQNTADFDNWSGGDYGGDSTAPVLSSPTGTSTGTSTATVGATTDEGNGTLYAVVTTSATQPSVAQIKAGQNHTGAAATWSGSLAISSTGAKTLNATGLSQGTTYYAHLVHNDAANNDSNRVVSASFTTAAVTITDAGDETFQPGESITITGTTFGASQGSGKVYLSPTDSIADGSKVEQTVTSWGASSITITVEKGALPYGAAYLFVQENGGVSNAAGYAVSFITRGAQRSMLLGIG